MNHIQDAVCAYLEAQTTIKTVRAGEHCAGKYPVLAVDIREEKTLLCAGGKQAEHTYVVTVTAAPNRERAGETAALAALVPVLLRGVPMVLTQGEKTVSRVLSPQGIKTEGDELSFHLKLSVPVPPKGSEGADLMQTLHFDT